MDKSTAESSNPTFLRRHLSQLKVLTRLLEHEIDSAKGAEISLDRELVESMLDTLEIFVEDVDGGDTATKSGGRRAAATAEKPSVTRLN